MGFCFQFKNNIAQIIKKKMGNFLNKDSLQKCRIHFFPSLLLIILHCIMYFFVECTDPPDIRNTTVHVTENSSVVYYECDTGFHLLGDNVITCINGSWSSPSLICNGEYMTAYNIINYNFEIKFKQ